MVCQSILSTYFSTPNVSPKMLKAGASPQNCKNFWSYKKLNKYIESSGHVSYRIHGLWTEFFWEESHNIQISIATHRIGRACSVFSTLWNFWDQKMDWQWWLWALSTHMHIVHTMGYTQRILYALLLAFAYKAELFAFFTVQKLSNILKLTRSILNSWNDKNSTITS